MAQAKKGLTALAVLSLALVALAPGAPALAREQASPASMGVLWQNSTGQNATLWSVRWSPDQSFISATYFDNTTTVYESTTGKAVVRLGAHPRPAGRCDGEKECTVADHFPMRVSAWSPDGKYLAMGGDDRLILVYSTADWSLFRTLHGHRGSVLALDFSPDGELLASGSGTDKVEMNNANDENIVRIWDWRNSTAVSDLSGHRDGVMEVKWSPDGGRLASASDDKTVRLWSRANWSLEADLRGHTLGVLCADFSPDGRYLVTGSRDYTVRLWSLGNFSPAAKWGAPNCVRSVDYHPGGEWVAVSGVDETQLTVRNATTGVVLRTFTESSTTRSAVMSARWSPDGNFLAAGAGKEAVLRVYAFGKKASTPAPAIPWWVPNLVLYLVASSAMMVAYSYFAWRHARRERR